MDIVGEQLLPDDINKDKCAKEAVEHGVIEEPFVGMLFSSREEIHEYYAKYAKHVGFCIAKRSQKSGDDGEIRYLTIECSRAGKRKCKSLKAPLKPSMSMKMECKAKIRSSLQKDGRYMLSTVMLEHNHVMSPSKSRHFKSNKRLDNHVKRRLELNDQVGINVCKNVNALVKSTYNDVPVGPNAQWIDKIYKKFNQVTSLVANSEERCMIVINGMDEIINKLLTNESMCGNNQVVSDELVECADESISLPKESNKVLSSLAVRQKGRPPSKRKASKIDEIGGEIKARRKKQTKKEAPCNSYARHVVDGIETQESKSLMTSPSSYVPCVVDQVGTQQNMNLMVPCSFYAPCVADEIETQQSINLMASSSFYAPHKVDESGTQESKNLMVPSTSFLTGSNQILGGGFLTLLENLSQAKQ